MRGIKLLRNIVSRVHATAILPIVLIAGLLASLNASPVYAYVPTSINATTLTDNNGNNCGLGKYRHLPIQLREFDLYSSFDPDIRFVKPNDECLRMDSCSGGSSSTGRGYAFLVIGRGILQGARIKVRWNVFHSYPDPRDLDLATVYVFDGHFDRRNMDSYFKPDQDREPIFDYLNVKVLQYPFQHKVGWSGWFESISNPLVSSTWTNDSASRQEYVTVLVRMVDSWTADTVMVDVDYLQILDARSRVLCDFQFAGSIKMELIDTLNDYGILAHKNQTFP
jgi:hypothetical protein